MMAEEFACSHCGEMLPADATFCRHCGSSDEYGWDKEDPWSETDSEDDDAADGEDEFDYDDFVAREFPEHSDANHPRLRKANWTLLVIVLVCGTLVLSAIMAALSGRFF